MAISPAQNVELLRAVQAKAASAAPEVVMDIAESYRDRLQHVTLRRYTHSYGTKTDSPPGQPPAYVLGALSRSITSVLTFSSGTRASAVTAPHVIYARLQELGGIIRPHGHPYLRWRGLDGQWVYKRSVEIPPRPYMRPTTEDMILDGSFTREAMASFMAVVWG